MSIISKNVGGTWPLWPSPGYTYECISVMLQAMDE